MIQRIQSVFLLLVSVVMVIAFLSPFLEIRMPDSTSITVYVQGMIKGGNIINPTWGVIVIACISALLPLINIFLYKKRKVQIRIGYLTSFFLIFFYVTLVTYLYFFINKNGAEIASVNYGIFLPIISLIFNILAISKIKKDEKLVKSLDRIR